MTKPVFYDGQHVGWTVIIAHQADVGGAVPGSYNPMATDLWQEALRLTPVKVYEGGRLRRDVWDLIMGNVRLSVVADDVHAMIGACSVGERELISLLDRYGFDVFSEAMEQILDSTEEIARQSIRDIPDGTYRSEWSVYDSAIDHNEIMTIRVAVTVADDHMTVDFAGTDSQSPGYVNAPLSVTLSSVMIVFFMVAGRAVPHNDAIMRCITVRAPQGSLLNCSYPAPSGFGNHLSDPICSAMMKALAEPLAKRVTAGWNPLLCSIVSGVDDRHDKPFVDILVNACKGGGGGTYGAHGYDHIGLIGSGGAIAAQDPEMFEYFTPLRLHHFEYATDSAGAGRWRGGLGVDTQFEFRNSSDVQLSVFGDGGNIESAAPGVWGGLAGMPNSIEITYPDGWTYYPYLKDLVVGVPEGTRYRQLAGGGGGYGDPLQRPVCEVVVDVQRGYLTPERAWQEYQVVVDAATGTCDETATMRLRNNEVISTSSA